MNGVLDSLTDHFQLLDAEWRFVYVNPAARRAFARHGIDPDWLIGKRFWTEVFPQVADADWPAVTSSRSASSAWSSGTVPATERRAHTAPAVPLRPGALRRCELHRAGRGEDIHQTGEHGDAGDAAGVLLAVIPAPRTCEIGPGIRSLKRRPLPRIPGLACTPLPPRILCRGYLGVPRDR